MPYQLDGKPLMHSFQWTPVTMYSFQYHCNSVYTTCMKFDKHRTSVVQLKQRIESRTQK